MNRQQRKAAGKGQSDERVNVTGIVVHFENGQYAQLDIERVSVVDKDTGRPLFQEVLEPVQAKSQDKPSHSDFPDERTPNKEDYVVTFDTPEGRMEYVKKGDWAGVRKA
jgi:hypothetical protein